MRDLKTAARLLEEDGVAAVLVKGWALGRVYAEPGIRPFGDIDFCVRPEDYPSAQRALARSTYGTDIDLHSGFEKFYDGRTEELFSRSSWQDLDGTPVRVLRAEDHFRFLCLHLLRHGGARPLWSCDVAAMIEAQGGVLDWDLCLSCGPVHRHWVSIAIGVASELLACELKDVPREVSSQQVPAWVLSTVLQEWGVPFAMPSPMRVHSRKPLQFLRQLPSHWPNGIEATINFNGNLTEWPRWPFQVADVVTKAFRLVTQLSS
jgi:hypothetical protein